MKGAFAPAMRETGPSRQEVLELRLPDGSGNTLLLDVPDGDSVTRAILLCVPAMGVRADFYARFREAVQGEGIVTAACEMRGNGRSTVRAGRASDFGYHEMVCWDLAAAMDGLSTAYPGVPVFVLGHSLGGQMAALYAASHPSRCAGAVLVACGTPYHRNWGFPRAAWILARIEAAAALAGILGFFPGRLFGFGWRESRRLIREWRSLARSGRFEGDGILAEGERILRDLPIPVLSVAIKGDPLAPPAAISHFTKRFRSVDTISTTAESLSRQGKHFDWVRSGETAGRIRDWILARVTAASDPDRGMPASPEAHYPPGVRRHIPYPEETILDFLAEACDRYPARPAYEFMGKKFTFAQVESYASRLARFLYSRGVSKGDRVLVCLPNVPQLPFSILAILKLGAVCVMSNPLLSPVEIAGQIRDSGCRTAITLDLLLERFQATGCRELLETVIFTHLNDFLPAPAKWVYPIARRGLYRKVRAGGGLYAFRECLKAAVGIAMPLRRPEMEGLALLIYTGGTTGVPKGVELTHRNVACNVRQITEWLTGFESGQERVLGVFPFFTGAGFTALMAGALARAAMVALIPRPTPAEVMKAAKRVRATLLPAVPTIYAGLLAHPGFRAKARGCFGNLKICLSGAAPLPAALKSEWQAITGITIAELYGLSETTAMTHGNPLHRTKAGSVGLPISDTDCKIVDPDNGSLPVAPGCEGEICLRGPQVTRGYYRNPGETAAVIRDGWLHTGDIGFEDEDGYLFIVGRKKEMIISGGYNVYSREVEDALRTHPGVEEAAAVGVPDPYRGQSIKAYIKPRPGHAPAPGDLDKHCRANLASYKLPKSYQFVEDFPKNALGKIIKAKLT